MTNGSAVAADHDGPRPVATSMLPRLLLEPAAISDIMRSPGMHVDGSRTKMIDSSSEFPDYDCVVAWMPVERSVYADSGWTATAAKSLSDISPKGFVIEAATAFNTRDAARSFFDEIASHWSSCGDRTFTSTRPGHADTLWTFDKVTNVDSTLWMSQTPDDSPEWTCQRALRVSNNIAIDVLTCKDYGDDEAVTIVNAIDARLPSI
ncbi:sensor domain-containing protein [Mycolicibacter minnesotensis]